MTICDLSFVRYPRLFNRSNAMYLATIARLSAHKPTTVLTISESTRRDVIRLFGVAPDNVVTTYCGVSDRSARAGNSDTRIPPAKPASQEFFSTLERLGLGRM